MKKRKIFILVICIMILVLTGCGKDNLKILKESVDKIEFTGNLVTYQAYYHNIIEYPKPKDSFLEKDRKLFAEYTAIVDLGIDMRKVKVTVKDKDTINVYLPKAKIINGPNISKDEFTEKKFIESSDNLIFQNKITADDSTKAVLKAQDEIKKDVNNDENLLDLARKRARLILEENIKQLIDLSEKEYTISWEYEN